MSSEDFDTMLPDYPPPQPPAPVEEAEVEAAPTPPGPDPQPAAQPFDPPLHALDSRLRGHRQNDPYFFFVVAIAFSVGLSPLEADVRYAILWTLLALMGALHWLLDDRDMRGDIHLGDLSWGLVFGLMAGVPILLLVGQSVLREVSFRIFPNMPDGAVLQTLVFVMPLAETLFFRGMIQAGQSWPVTAGLASVWSVLLIFPVQDLRNFAYVALITGIFIVMLNVLYSYVRERNGLSAAWLCQVVASLLWLFVPRLFS